jgi:hypothetical protein
MKTGKYGYGNRSFLYLPNIRRISRVISNEPHRYIEIVQSEKERYREMNYAKEWDDPMFF